MAETTDIEGTVFDRKTHKPVQDATVSLGSTVFSETTDAEGWFKIKEVPLGVYTIRIQAEEYLDHEETIGVKPFAAQRGFEIGASTRN